MAQPLQRQYLTQKYCSSIKCDKQFTPGPSSLILGREGEDSSSLVAERAENRGKFCAGCHTSVYCNLECQKIDWQSHKTACKAIRKQQQERANAGPDLRQDFLHLCTMSTVMDLFSVMARSALRLGRPDSLATTHFMQIQLYYSPPPPERAARTSSKHIGDELDFFDFYKVRVAADKDSPDGGARKRAEFAKGLLRANEGENLYALLCTVVYKDDQERYMNFLDIRHVPQSKVTFPGNYPPPLDQRALNSKWEELLGLARYFSADPSVDQNAWELQILHFTDLAFSETLEHLDSLEFQPDDGWELFKTKITHELMHKAHFLSGVTRPQWLNSTEYWDGNKWIFYDEEGRVLEVQEKEGEVVEEEQAP